MNPLCCELDVATRTGATLGCRSQNNQTCRDEIPAPVGWDRSLRPLLEERPSLLRADRFGADRVAEVNPTQTRVHS